jgi:hypothetical protein
MVAGCGTSGHNTVATGNGRSAVQQAGAKAAAEGDDAALALCEKKLEGNKNNPLTVSAGFTSTVGTVNQWKVKRTPNSPMQQTFSDDELASTDPITVCFVDGDIQAPMGPNSTAAPYTRAIMMIDAAGNVQPDVAGTIESLPIVRPSATAGL